MELTPTTLSSPILDDDSFTTDADYSIFELDVLPNLHETVPLLYEYWRAKGFFNICITYGMRIITLLSVVTAVTVATVHIDYDVLWATHSLVAAFTRVPNFPMWLVLLDVCFGAYILRVILQICTLLSKYNQIRSIVSGSLQIYDISTHSWDEVAEKFYSTYETDMPLNRYIMVRDNHLMSLINNNILRLQYPTATTQHITLVNKWLIINPLLNKLFMADGSLRPALRQAHREPFEVMRLKKFICRYGVLAVLAAPFMLIGLVAYFLVRYGDEIRTRPSILGERDWTTYAKIRFRRYDELEHDFDCRIAESYPLIKKYMEAQRSLVLIAVVRFLIIILGAVFVFVAVLGLAEINFGQFSILPGLPSVSTVVVLAVLTAVLNALRRIMPKKYTIIDDQQALADLNELLGPFTRADVGRLYQHQAFIWAGELLSVLTVPLMLWSVYKSVDDIVPFLRNEIHVYNANV